MNPVYSPVQPGAPYGNPKNMAYTGYPTAYPAAAPAYNPSLYPTSSPSYAPGKQRGSGSGEEGGSRFPFVTTEKLALLFSLTWSQPVLA